MAKRYIIGLGIALLALGVLNFFAPGLRTGTLHAVIHIIFGVLGIALVFRSDSTAFIKWTMAASLILAAVGFFGVKEVGQILQFPIFLKWVYLILGLLSLWVYLTLREVRIRSEKIN